MSMYDDGEDDELEELAEEFRQAADSGCPVFFDREDFEDVIALFLENGQMDYARKALNAAVEQFPDEQYFRLQYAKYYALDMDFKAAFRELDYVENNYEPIPELFIEKVLISHAFNQEVDGVELLQRALSLDPDIPEAHMLLAHEYLADNDLDSAVQHAVRAIELDELAAEDLKIVMIDFQGLLVMRQSNIIIDFYSRLTEEMPMCGSIWSGLGLAYMNHSDFDQAVEAFQFQLSLDEDDSSAYINLAEALSAAGKYEEALHYFETAREKCNVLDFNLQIGRCYYNMQDYDNALFFFLQTKEDDPMYVFVPSEVVRVLKAQGKFDEARAYLRNQLEKDPQNIDAIEDLIDLLDPQKHTEEIRQLCDMALNSEFNPKYGFLSFFVFYCCHTEGADLGIDICIQFVDDPDICTDVQYFLAALYLEKGQVELGCEFLELALQADPQPCVVDFEDMDPDFANIPEVAELLRIYKDDEQSSTPIEFLN